MMWPFGKKNDGFYPTDEIRKQVLNEVKALSNRELKSLPVAHQLKCDRCGSDAGIWRPKYGSDDLNHSMWFMYNSLECYKEHHAIAACRVLKRECSCGKVIYARPLDMEIDE